MMTQHQYSECKQIMINELNIYLHSGAKLMLLTHFSPVLHFMWKPVICFALENRNEWFLYEMQQWAEMG